MSLKTATILVNWNSTSDTLACIDSLRQLSGSACDIVVVDNNSDRESFEQLIENVHNVIILRSNKNTGFAGGNNIGIRYALTQNFSHLWILNNDTIVRPDSLALLERKISGEEQIGMVGCGIVYYTEPETIWSWGGKCSKPWFIADSIGLNKNVRIYKSSSTVPDFISGCSQFVSSLAVKNVGLMPEEYFMYWEDVDWSFSFKKYRYKISFIDQALVLHKIGKSIGTQNPIKNYYKIRNSLWFSKKHLDTYHKALSIAVRMGQSAFLLAKNPAATKFIINGFIDGLLKSPVITMSSQSSEIELIQR